MDMSEQSGKRLVFNTRLQLFILIVLIINTSLIALGLLYFVQRYTRTDPTILFKQELARDLAEYNQRLALECGVLDAMAVREAMAEYNFEVDMAKSGDDLIRTIFDQGRRVQEIIFIEADSRVREEVLMVVNADSRVMETSDSAHIFIRMIDGKIDYFPDQFLEPDTLKKINTLLTASAYYGNQAINIEITDGVAKIVVPQTEEEQIRALTEDLNSIRLRLHEIRVQSGLAEMVGPGIILSVYDADPSEGDISLVHDADIRDLVNELFSAGAQGISVGNQRLTITSSIRCSGPLIMVNYRQIATNPVVIEAVGDPELMISGLAIIRKEMESRRGLRFEINHSGFIKLPAYALSD